MVKTIIVMLFVVSVVFSETTTVVKKTDTLVSRDVLIKNTLKIQVLENTLSNRENTITRQNQVIDSLKIIIGNRRRYR
jgi:hypothetical protein